MNKLAIHGGNQTINPKDAQFHWPLVTKELEQIVIKQLHKTTSIYNRSGIFEEFETKFSEYHNMPYALLSNSGTSAIFSMMEGIELKPGDEVICPTYTFFATISPILYTGATPIFCDCTATGNIDPSEIEKKITKKTKAVIVTHMWGIPCEMDRIIEICNKQNIFLLEDCSHAHGASFQGRKTGSFGDAAAWSLQGQKIISGGEGGILLTKHKDIFSRALLQGHYNKRCKQEISQDDPLFQFALTGLGLKLRAHPLAIAIANHQFNQLDTWIDQKQIYADVFMNEFEQYPFLSMPIYKNSQPSWYAFVMQFIPDASNNVTIEQFEAALHAEGLIEVDRPGSTCPTHNLPIFTKPHVAMPRLYKKTISTPEEFSNANKFYENAIKLPVWAHKNDGHIMESYVAGFKKVCDTVMKEPHLMCSI